MRVEHRLINNTLYVGLMGELDEHSSHYCRSTLDSLFCSLQMKRVIVDMSELGFMDSTGIGVLIGRFKKLQERQVPIFIANPSRAVDKIFTLTGIYDIMPKIV